MSLNSTKEAYDVISESYLSKKTQIWYELSQNVEALSSSASGIFYDIGCGNGRNIQKLDRTLIVGLDISQQLLRNFTVSTAERVSGSITQLPFRRKSASEAISIAVIHHLPTYELRTRALQECHRSLSSHGILIVSVWRKWRSGMREKLFGRIRNSSKIDDLVDELRPWKDSSGLVIGHRYYHYYTWKELWYQINEAEFKLVKSLKMGGKANDANFLIWLSKSSQETEVSQML